MDPALGKEGAGPVDRVAGTGGEHVIAGIDKCLSDMGDTILGAHQGNNLFTGIERDAEPLLVPVSNSAPVRGHTHV